MAFTTRGSLLSAVRRGDEVGWDEFTICISRSSFCAAAIYG